MSRLLERRLGSPGLAQRWDCLAVDAAELAPRPPRETWIGIAAEEDVAAIAWAERLPTIGRTLVRTHILARYGVDVPHHERALTQPPWVEQLKPYVETIARNSTILRLVADPRTLWRLLDWAHSTGLPIEDATGRELAYFDSNGIGEAELAHDGDSVVAAHAAGVELVSYPAFPTALRKHHRTSPTSAIEATVLAFWAAR